MGEQSTSSIPTKWVLLVYQQLVSEPLFIPFECIIGIDRFVFNAVRFHEVEKKTMEQRPHFSKFIAGIYVFISVCKPKLLSVHSSVLFWIEKNPIKQDYSFKPININQLQQFVRSKGSSQNGIFQTILI